MAWHASNLALCACKQGQIFEYGLTWENIKASMLWLDQQPKLAVQGAPTGNFMEKLATSLHAAQSTGGSNHWAYLELSASAQVCRAERQQDLGAATTREQ
eukprot:2291689-Amphidinium_carterae.1